MVKELVCKNIKEIPGTANKALSFFPDNKLFAVYGPMGVGKTTFIKALCKELGVKDIVNSPSFGLVHNYKLPNNDPVYHFDFYRIKKQEEAFDIGYEDYFFSGHYCFIEWPEKVTELLPNDCVKIFMKEDNGVRFFSIETNN